MSECRDKDCPECNATREQLAQAMEPKSREKASRDYRAVRELERRDEKEFKRRFAKAVIENYRGRNFPYFPKMKEEVILMLCQVGAAKLINRLRIMRDADAKKRKQKTKFASAAKR